MISVLVRYQELALKGKNRPWFQRHLVQHLQRALAGLGVREVRVPMGRIELVLSDAASADEVRARLKYVFGVANFSLATRVAPDADRILAGILRDLPAGRPASFRVKVWRADAQFPIPSPEMERRIGGPIAEATGWTVDLRDPAMTIGVEILPGEAFYHFGKEPGPGGLPIGTGGRVVALMSGGIDSPVATYRMMRRGCRATLIHFHSYPFLSRASQDKARQLAALLARYQLSLKLLLVPFGEIQRQVTMTVPSALRVVVYRRLMLRIADRVAHHDGAHALVTGDVVGQVASQTLENLAAAGHGITRPILRPLVGMDKGEIINEAIRLGTYDISIQPDEDCCTLFTPRHPVTRARRDEILAAEAALPVDAFIDTALREAHRERIDAAVPCGEASAGSPR